MRDGAIFFVHCLYLVMGGDASDVTLDGRLGEGLGDLQWKYALLMHFENLFFDFN